MGKRARCVHCLNIGRATVDHAPPKAWYPRRRNPRVQFATAKACRPCNRRFGIAEQAIQEDLGLALSGCEVSSAGALSESARRSIEPSWGRDDGDRRAREHRLQQLRWQASVPPSPNTVHVPGFGPSGRKGKVAIPFADEYLLRFAEKMTRVLTHWKFRRFIELGQVQSGMTDAWVSKLPSNRTLIVHAPDLVSIAVPVDWKGQRGLAWSFRLWERLTLQTFTPADAFFEDRKRLPMDTGGQ